MEKRKHLVSVIQNAMTANKNLTLHSLSVRCGIGYSTLRRIMQNECEPSDSTVMSIVTNLLSPQDASEYFAVAYPQLGKAFRVYAEKKVEPVRDASSLRHLTRDEYLAFIIVSSRNRVARKSLEAMIGYQGADAIDRLLELEIVKEVDSHIVSHAKDVVFHDLESTLEHIEHARSLFPKSKVDRIGNIYNLKAQGLNPKGVTAVSKLVFEFLAHYDEIVLDEKYRGNEVTTLALTQSVIEEKNS